MENEDHTDPRDARIAELERQLAQALDRIAELERRLGMDSTNSSLPPSQDPPKARSQRKRRKRSSGRAQGGQPGSTHTKRQLLDPEDVDVFVTHFPQVCKDCCHPLDPVPTASPVRHQRFDLPAKLVEVTEHQLHACMCGVCGAQTRAQIPQHLKTGWAPGLVALLGYLRALGLTRRKTHAFAQDVLEVPSSLGTLQNHFDELTDALEPLHKQAKAAVAKADRIGCDETRWFHGNQTHWVWGVQSKDAAFFEVHPRRTKAVAQALLEDMEFTYITLDRYAAYAWIGDERVQACRAHLLRDFEALAQTPATQDLGERLVRQERRLHQEWGRWRDGEQTWEEFLAHAERVKQLQDLACGVAAEQGRAPPVCRWLLSVTGRKRGWQFMGHEGSVLTNNASERGVRPVVLERKTSYFSQSGKGLRMVERMASVRETARLQSKQLFRLLKDALQALRTGSPPPLLV